MAVYGGHFDERYILQERKRGQKALSGLDLKKPRVWSTIMIFDQPLFLFLVQF